MTNIVKIVLGASLVLSLGATTCSADIAKGKKLFTKKLKNACGLSGQALAGKHTQAQWKKIFEKGKMAKEIQTICPKVKDSAVKEKFLKHYYDFLHEFASDSGNVPSC